jgi:hypothetical protein
VMLFREKTLKDTRITWAEQTIAQPSTTSTSTMKWAAEVGTPDTLTSRGYREEQEHLAYLIRHPEAGAPRCSGDVALADAVITLTSNMAMKLKRRIEFRSEWFDPASDAAPETDSSLRVS